MVSHLRFLWGQGEPLGVRASGFSAKQRKGRVIYFHAEDEHSLCLPRNRIPHSPVDLLALPHCCYIFSSIFCCSMETRPSYPIQHENKGLICSLLIAVTLVDHSQASSMLSRLHSTILPHSAYLTGLCLFQTVLTKISLTTRPIGSHMLLAVRWNPLRKPFSQSGMTTTCQNCYRIFPQYRELAHTHGTKLCNNPFSEYSACTFWIPINNYVRLNSRKRKQASSG